MKKTILVLVLSLLATSAFSWDWYGFYYDPIPLATEFEVTGTVYALFR
jgi:hypothetical protein